MGHSVEDVVRRSSCRGCMLFQGRKVWDRVRRVCVANSSHQGCLEGLYVGPGLGCVGSILGWEEWDMPLERGVSVAILAYEAGMIWTSARPGPGIRVNKGFARRPQEFLE